MLQSPDFCGVFQLGWCFQNFLEFEFFSKFELFVKKHNKLTGSILTMVESAMMDRSQWQANQSKTPRFRSVEVCIIHMLCRCVKLLAVQHISSMQC